MYGVGKVFSFTATNARAKTSVADDDAYLDRKEAEFNAKVAAFDDLECTYSLGMWMPK